MATLERFEDIVAWRKARELTREVYKVTATGEFSRDYSLKDQIRRAAVSVMSNIAEGFERDGNREFQQFLGIAKGSVGEIRAQLYVALDAGFLSQAQFQSLSALAAETGRLIGGFMRYLKETQYEGRKFREQDETYWVHVNPELETRNSELSGGVG
ncbi:MAG: four helix bundle protein [Chloroflexota bacterium]